VFKDNLTMNLERVIKMNVLEQIRLTGIIPIITINDAKMAIPICQAISDGGINIAEITFRTTAAEESIRNVQRAFPKMIIGAGTVMTIEQAKCAMEAGASFILSAALNPEVVAWCIEHNILIFPGVNTTEGIEKAMKLGVNCVKIFPVEATGGMAFIKAISAPYPNMSYLPTGGINENNLLAYLNFPKNIACGGSWMVPKDAIEKEDMDRIRVLTKNAVQKLHGFHLSHIGINCKNSDEALQIANYFTKILDLPSKEGNNSIFITDSIEICKYGARGEYGHISIGVNSLSRAVYYLEQKGFAFDANSIKKNNDGTETAIYFENEIAGFAIHLLQV